MAAELMLLHSRQGDAQIYDEIRRSIAPGATLRHVVRPDWRLRALRDGMTWQLRREIDSFVRTAEHPVICTCPILAETAEFAGALRIDRASMRAAACTATGTVLLVTITLEAAEPALAALEEAMAAHANDHAVLPLVLDQFQALRDSGDLAGFHAAIAAAVIEAVAARRDLTTVILAETLMQPAARLLDGIGPDLLTIPEPGLRQALGLHARASLGEPMTT